MKPVADVVALDEERAKRGELSESALQTAGGMLRAAREASRLTAVEVAERTNIKVQHLAAIEEMNPAALPAQPYTMGFVRAYAREVDLPEEALMDRFRQQVGWQKREQAPKVAPVKGSAGSADGSRELSVLALLAIIGFVLWCAWRILIAASPEAPEQSARFAFSKDDQTERVVDNVGMAERAAAEALVERLADAAEERAGAEPDLQSAGAVSPSDAQPRAGAGTERASEDRPPRGSEDARQPAAEPAAQRSAAPVPEPVTEPVTEPLRTPSTAPSSAATAEPRPAPVRLRRVSAADPNYPPLCENAAAPQEQVTIRYSVDAGGFPTRPTIIRSTNPCFNGAAVAALVRWRYDADSVRPENSQGLRQAFIFDKPQ